MARKSTLIKLLTDLRAECRLSPSPAHNKQVRDTQVELLQRTQEWLWSDFSWPHLRVDRQIPVQSGQRYYTPPEDLDIERIEHIKFFDGVSWSFVRNGVGAEEYNCHNSDLDARSYPPRAWRLSEDDDIELWPIPDRNADVETREGFLQFTGIRKLRPFVHDGDRADLDDRLITLFAAAEILGAAGAKDAEIKMSQANKRYLRLRGQLSKKGSFQMFGVASSRQPRVSHVGRYIRPVVN